MRDLLDSLTNRDYAIGIWLVALLAFTLRSESVRSSFISVVKAATQKQILLTVALVLAWTIFTTSLAAKLGYWSSGQLKTSAYWFLFAALPTLGSVAEASKDQRLVLKPIRDSLKLTILSEFFVNLYAFHLLIELALFPILVAITAMIVIAGQDEQNKRAKGCLEWIMAIIVFLILAYQIRMIYADPTHGLNSSNLRDLLLPIYYTAAYIPCMFFVAVLVAYEEVFGRLRFVVKNKPLIPYAKVALLKGFKADIRSLNRWFRRSWEEPLLSKDQIEKLIRDVKHESET